MVQLELLHISGGVATYGTAQKIALANNTKLTVEFAVPQRLAFDGETAGYWDLGNMTYSPDAPNAFGGGGGPGKCDSSRLRMLLQIQL
jgi:hypothetical protein